MDAKAKGNFTSEKWYHVALVKDSGRIRLWVDGVEVSSVACPDEMIQSEVDRVSPRYSLLRRKV